MNNFLQTIQSGKVLLLDGAMGTMLWTRGLSGAKCPEEYNLTHSETLEEIALDYLNAGSDLIQTNTFGGSLLKLARYSLEKDYQKINANAVLAVKKAVKDKAFISASCGPSGEILKPYGDKEPEELYDSFNKQIRVLIEEGADIIHIETMSDIHEALLALKAAKDISGTIPVMVSMTYNKIPRGFYTIMGTDIKTTVEKLEENGADIIGSNCGNGSESMIHIAGEIKENTKLPVVIQPNAGMPELKGTRTIYPESGEFMAAKGKILLEAGVSIIGGCCGTTPEHISAMRSIIDERRK